MIGAIVERHTVYLRGVCARPVGWSEERTTGVSIPFNTEFFVRLGFPHSWMDLPAWFRNKDESNGIARPGQTDAW